MNLFSDRYFRWFVIRFLLIFSAGYFGTLAVIGLAAPGGQYSPFIDKYLDYVSWMRMALLHGSKWLLGLFDIQTYITAEFHIRYVNGRGVYLAYDCVGYGVMFFWIALVTALPAKWGKRILWFLIGMFVLWFINVCRISLFLVVTNKNTQMPLGLDHHTWFNIFAYLAIFILMYFFYRSTNEPVSQKAENKDSNASKRS